MAEYNWHDIPVEVFRKKIKNMHLRIHLATGRVRISAPLAMDIGTIRSFVASRKNWITKHRERCGHLKQEPLRYASGEAHYYLGKHYVLRPTGHAHPGVALAGDCMEVNVRGRLEAVKVKRALGAWYREQLAKLAEKLIIKWERPLGVAVKELAIRAMKTKWGSCRPGAARICLNLDLIRRRSELIEFVVVHELVHLIERKHNERFKKIMGKFIPDWKLLRKELNTMSAG